MRLTESFDYETYIQERLREIDDIEERKFAKKLLLDGLGRIFDTIEERYEQLEQRIANEVEIAGSRYEVAMTIIRQEYYDPLNTFFFPVCWSDVEKGGSGNQKPAPCQSGFRFAVYLEADDQTCKAFMHSQYVTGRMLHNNTRVKFRISKCQQYQDAMADLYRLFGSNKVPWNTVHMGHLERFFDLTLVAGEEDDSTGELSEKDVVLEWGPWQPYVRRDMLLLWNINTYFYENNNFIMPCIDKIHYEYVVNIEKTEEQGYLFEIGGSIHNVIYEKERVVIQTTEEIDRIKAYIFHHQGGAGIGSYQYSYPVFTNRNKGSFCGRYLYKTGVFLQTRADLTRKIVELSGTYEIPLSHYELRDEIPADALGADMNTFVEGEVFPNEKRRIMALYFQGNQGSDCYYQSQVRYILSRLQQEYLEYKCVGVLE